MWTIEKRIDIKNFSRQIAQLAGKKMAVDQPTLWVNLQPLIAPTRKIFDVF